MTFESTSSEDVLKYGLGVLKEIYKKAKKKEDAALMLNIADRLLVLYESMSDPERSKRGHHMGFVRIASEEDDDRG